MRKDCNPKQRGLSNNDEGGSSSVNVRIVIFCVGRILKDWNLRVLDGGNRVIKNWAGSGRLYKQLCPFVGPSANHLAKCDNAPLRCRACIGRMEGCCTPLLTRPQRCCNPALPYKQDQWWRSSPGEMPLSWVSCQVQSSSVLVLNVLHASEWQLKGRVGRFGCGKYICMMLVACCSSCPNQAHLILIPHLHIWHCLDGSLLGTASTSNKSILSNKYFNND